MSSHFLSKPLASGEKLKNESIKKKGPYKIFFKDLFLFKESEMAEKKKEKFLNHSKKIHQKSTFSSRMKSRSHLSQIAFRADTGVGSFEKFMLDPALILRLQDGAGAKRNIHEFISDQRNRFLLEYTLSTKRSTITKFEKCMETEEQQILKAETKLQDDAVAFEEFLRENDQRSVDALKVAAQETVNKLHMMAELKKASLEVQAVKSEISKAEFLLKEYMKYGLFLLKLSPKQWQIQQALKRVQVSKSKENTDGTLPKILTKLNARMGEGSAEDIKKMSILDDYSPGTGSQGNTRDSGLHSQNFISCNKEQGLISNYMLFLFTSTIANNMDSAWTFQTGKPRKESTRAVEKSKMSLSNRPTSVSSEDSLDDESDYDLEPELYFKEPEELLQVLTELEEQNLTLVQYSQDVDENLEDVNKREKLIRDKINSNIEFLLEHKEMLKANCLREEEKAAELELRSRLFNFGEFNSEAQEKLIDSLSKKINQVYKVCIGDGEVGGLNTVQKLVKIESRLVELSDLIETIPKENVDAIERIKQKERRQKLREEKMKEKQRHQEERLRAALERAVAQPKKKLGRRLVYRSNPPSGNKQELLLVQATRTRSIEEEYFFT
ncbi:coiled-coil domain-containing protein 38 [Sturnira hondurensis]|uniref:coiled-coil domain-containing protein 38 n=1 Tax=Sturnira hondurensis TaxID=192404 RepID=UPI0018790BBD|nr:coiled-coil domain-containing protein 38 [Sturnira hondurensis]